MLGILLLKAKRDGSAKCLVKLACPNKQNSEQFELKQNTKKFFFFFPIKSSWLLLIWSATYAVELSHSC